jgi:hypothetical protein
MVGAMPQKFSNEGFNVVQQTFEYSQKRIFNMAKHDLKIEATCAQFEILNELDLKSIWGKIVKLLVETFFT